MDPANQLKAFRAQMLILKESDMVWSKMFVEILSDAMLDCFSTLPGRNVSLHVELSSLFFN